MNKFHYILTLLLFYSCLSSTQEKIAMIIGVTGQDGSYLTEFLLSKGYIVHGLKRRTSSRNTERINHIYNDPANVNRFFLHNGDVSDSGNLMHLIEQIKPDEIYNLSAQSHVKVSFDMPLFTSDINALGVLRILEAIRVVGDTKKIKFYQASTSEMFGKVQEIPQTEITPFYPRSPYGVSKLFAHWITKNYREAYDMFACSGILFNHESPRRGETFVTRKIARAAARISCGLQKALFLGNLDSRRDWGHAQDYVEAMWLMLQQEQADDYVIASGETHSVREFAELAFAHVGIQLTWKGSGVNEIGYDSNTGKELIFVHQNYFRPTEVDLLIGDASKAQIELGWKPKTTFIELVNELVESELNNVNHTIERNR